MPSINEVIERVSRARPDALDDNTKAGWLIELDGKLEREVIVRHTLAEVATAPEPPRTYPEDGDKPLLAQPPYDNLYDLYLMAQIDFYNREPENYNNSALAFNAALDEYKKDYHRTHAPIGAEDPATSFKKKGEET